MKKQAIFAAPFLAAVTFVCNPMFADDKVTDSAGGNGSRAAEARDPSGAPASAGQAANDSSTDPVRIVGNGAAEPRLAGAREAGAREQGNMDEKCVAHIADVNNFEIRAGQLAQDKAQNEEIKRFAKMMVDEHTLAQQQLQQIAQQKGWQLSEQLMPVHQAMLDKLNKVDGRNFDRAYLYGQVAGHTETALWLRDAKGESQDAELKQYVSTILPKVQAHLRHGQQLANAGDAMPAGARIERDRDGDNAGQERSGPGATDRLRPGETDRAPSDKTDSSGGGRPGRGAAPAPGASDIGR